MQPDDIPPMSNLDANMLMDVEAMAAGMSQEEVLEYFDLELDDLDETESIYFVKHYKRGKGAAKRQMVDALMRAASGKNGGQFAALFLSKQAEEWPSGKDDIKAGNGFSFTVYANKDE